MNKSFLLVGIICGLLLFGGNAMALTIHDGTLVGEVDELIAQTNITPSKENQEAWIQSEIGEEYFVTEEKYSVSSSDWQEVFDRSILVDFTWATELKYAPEYYFIKIGTGGLSGNTDDHFLYRNLAEMNWAVIDFSKWGFDESTNINIGRISHIGEIGGTPVPEPGMVILLGIGLLGLAFYNRKRLLN